MIVRAFDLFCGVGDSSCGARQAGVEVVGGIELWDKAVETYRLNFPQAIGYDRPIKSLTARAVAFVPAASFFTRGIHVRGIQVRKL